MQKNIQKWKKYSKKRKTAQGIGPVRFVFLRSFAKHHEKEDEQSKEGDPAKNKECDLER